VFVSVHARARLKEQATALRPPANDFRIRSESLANFQRPSVLRHLSSIHWTACHSSEDSLSRLAKEAYRGLHTVSERRRDGCCSCAVVIRAVPVPSGYGVGSPDRLFGFSSYSKRFGPRRDFSPLSRETFRLQDQAGLDCWIYLIRLRETGHHVRPFGKCGFFCHGVLIFLLLQEMRAVSCLALGFFIAWICNIWNSFQGGVWG